MVVCIFADVISKTLNRARRRSLLDVKVCRGADVNSDHYMLLTKVKLKLLRVNKNKRCRKVYDINRLKSHEVRKSFSIELKNRFAALADIEYETDHDLVECSWKRIKESYTDTAKKLLALRKRSPRNGYKLKHGSKQKQEGRQRTC